MNKYMTTDCGNCYNFTHCNNNNLICISKYKVKERECEKLDKQVKALTMQLENLSKKLSRNKAVVEFADCPHYGYRDNTIEPTCTKNFCYDVKSCDYKNMIKYKQALDKIENIVADDDGLIQNYEMAYDLGVGILDIINKIKEKTINEKS